MEGYDFLCQLLGYLTQEQKVTSRKQTPGQWLLQSVVRQKIQPLPRPDHLCQNLPLANFSEPNAPENKYSTLTALPPNAQWRILKHLRRNIAPFWSAA